MRENILPPTEQITEESDLIGGARRHCHGCTWRQRAGLQLRCIVAISRLRPFQVRQLGGDLFALPIEGVEASLKSFDLGRCFVCS
jgi:hypothetical protein